MAAVDIAKLFAEIRGSRKNVKTSGGPTVKPGTDVPTEVRASASVPCSGKQADGTPCDHMGGAHRFIVGAKSRPCAAFLDDGVSHCTCVHYEASGPLPELPLWPPPVEDEGP